MKIHSSIFPQIVNATYRKLYVSGVYVSQKDTQKWMIGTIIGFSPWLVIWSVVDWFLHKDLVSVFSTMISLIVALVVVLALGSKYTSLRSGTKGFAIGMMVFAIAGFVVPFVVYPQLHGQFNPNFRILDTSDSFNSQAGSYVFYAQIRNDGIDGDMTVYCEVKKEDLTTKMKSQRVYLEHNEVKTISFSFSIYGDLGGKLVNSYRFSFEGVALARLDQKDTCFFKRNFATNLRLLK